MTHTAEQEREAVVAWLRTMKATEWNNLIDSGEWGLPWAWTIADAIQRGEHVKGGGNGEGA